MEINKSNRDSELEYKQSQLNVILKDKRLNAPEIGLLGLLIFKQIQDKNLLFSESRLPKNIYNKSIKNLDEYGYIVQLGKTGINLSVFV